MVFNQVVKYSMEQISIHLKQPCAKQELTAISVAPSQALPTLHYLLVVPYHHH